MIKIESKLPDLGVTIFSVMSALAQKLNALNLSQGFPDFPPPPELIAALAQATQQGYNQYPPGDGLLSLRQKIAAQFCQRDQVDLDPISEITITPGATTAILCAIQAVVNAGDEVIIFDPAYDSYAPAVKLAGAQAIHINLVHPDFHVDWNVVKDRINERTRLIIVNTPHNPSGAIWSKQDWQQLIELIQDKNICVLSDEVYEHLVFDGQQHYSALSFPELRDRSFVIGSFGKTFHVTGWKTGYCVAPQALMKVFRQIYQFANFCGVHPIQVALNQFIEQHPEHILDLPNFYQAKRDLFIHGIQHSKFQYLPSPGTYFQNLDFSTLRPELTDIEMCQYLAEQHKLVAIPISVFYQQPPQDLKLIRVCFAKREETLHLAGEILTKVQSQ